MKWVLIIALSNHYAYHVGGFNERMDCEHQGVKEINEIFAARDHDKSMSWDWLCMEDKFMPPRDY